MSDVDHFICHRVILVMNYGNALTQHQPRSDSNSYALRVVIYSVIRLRLMQSLTQPGDRRSLAPCVIHSILAVESGTEVYTFQVALRRLRARATFESESIN